MPRYVYRCTSCEELNLANHPSDYLKTDCDLCGGEDALVKVLTSSTYISSRRASTTKVGDLTEEFISDSRDELQQQIDDLKDNR